MCTCASCEFTNRHTGGFSTWPKGDPAGPRSSAAAYAAHVAHSRYGSKKRVDWGPAGAGFYGTPKGSTKAEVEAVLRASFVGVPIPYDERDDGPKPTVESLPVRRNLAQLARDLRRQAEHERRAA